MNIDKAVSCGITCEKLRKLEHMLVRRQHKIISSFIFATTVVYLHIWFCINVNFVLMKHD